MRLRNARIDPGLVELISMAMSQLIVS